MLEALAVQGTQDQLHPAVHQLRAVLQRFAEHGKFVRQIARAENHVDPPVRD
jgi:uncharacterized protein YukE